VVDLAAGVRQASYGWAFSSTLLAIVMEPTQASAMTARRLRILTHERAGLRVGLILNKAHADVDFGELNIPQGLPIWARLPYSDEVVRAERAGVALLDLNPKNALITALDDMITNLHDSRAVESIA